MTHILNLYHMLEVCRLLGTKSHLEALVKNIPTPEISSLAGYVSLNEKSGDF